MSGCALASVVPEATPHLTDLCKRRMGIDPVIAEPSNGRLGMEVRIDQPAQLGADRLVNAYSVACSGDVPAIVLDFGTATTFDIVLPASDKNALPAMMAG